MRSEKHMMLVSCEIVLRHLASNGKWKLNMYLPICKFYVRYRNYIYSEIQASWLIMQINGLHCRPKEPPVLTDREQKILSFSFSSI